MRSYHILLLTLDSPLRCDCLVVWLRICVVFDCCSVCAIRLDWEEEIASERSSLMYLFVHSIGACAVKQMGNQLYALLVTMGLSLVGGLVTGLLIKSPCFLYEGRIKVGRLIG